MSQRISCVDGRSDWIRFFDVRERDNTKVLGLSARRVEAPSAEVGKSVVEVTQCVVTRV